MERKGILYAIGAYLMWGLFPLYWKQLEAISALQLIGHRIVWSFALLLLFVVVTRQSSALRQSITPSALRTYLAAALLISANWFTYVWAVTHGYVVEASLGYYINPLLSVVLGVLIFRERMRLMQWVPIALAACGVAYLTVTLGSVPWIALVLAITFGLYGAIKKLAPLGSVFGLTLETGLVFLPALAYLIYSEMNGTGAFLHVSARENLMMAASGLITAVPLLFFAAAATRVPLTTIGVLQYMNPTIQFLLGVIVYREPFSHQRFIGFAVVWIGLVLFWVEGMYSRRIAPATPLPEIGEG